MTDATFAPREIAQIVQHWLDYQDAERKREGLPTDDDTHLMTPPTWPSRGALKAWVSGLSAAADDIERMQAALRAFCVADWYSRGNGTFEGIVTTATLDEAKAAVGMVPVDK